MYQVLHMADVNGVLSGNSWIFNQSANFRYFPADVLINEVSHPCYDINVFLFSLYFRFTPFSFLSFFSPFFFFFLFFPHFFLLRFFLPLLLKVWSPFSFVKKVEKTNKVLVRLHTTTTDWFSQSCFSFGGTIILFIFPA